IISEAEQMRVEAANALLKLLEEPPGNLVLILVTANIYQILPTIKSRCQLLRFTPLPEAQMHDILRRYHPKVDPGELSLLVRLSGYNLKRAFDFLDKNVLQIREQAIDLLRKVVLIHRSQELMAILEPVAARQNREDAQLLLWLLLLWFQDILHLKQLEDASAKLYNPDKKDTLRKFMGFTPNADITGIVWDIEGALQDLRDVRNFNPLLILMTLAIKLHQKLKKNKK
ncbi:MAG: DNA polymerase III subunit delta', partial [Calditrichaeota bacterium]|nr:DNA polymerase III subunit delta' [Calditrichota bacterium]